MPSNSFLILGFGMLQRAAEAGYNRNSHLPDHLRVSLTDGNPLAQTAQAGVGKIGRLRYHPFEYAN